MMNTALKTAMTASISDVFETMFFTSLDFNDQLTLDADGIPGEENTIACWIGFQGVFSGCFILMVPETLLFNLTENFMALDRDDISSEHTDGAIKEAVNMLAGSTLSAYDDKIEFHLTIPKIINIGEATAAGKKTGEEEIVVITETTQGCLALKAVVTQSSIVS